VNTTTTVRLSDQERELLADLAGEYGGQSGAIRQGIHLLAQQKRRSEALREFLDEWAQEAGPPDREDVAAMRRRYFSQ
jgi:Arc/MetJ-type ribon-helix-helix transcriptional regulator